MGRGILTILLLVMSNTLMTFAWYGNLKFKGMNVFPSWGIFGIILVSWGIAFVEYCFLIPANRVGFQEMGGPFNLVQLKVIQEVISLTVFSVIAIFIFRVHDFNYNHLIAFFLLVGAVYFIFK